jgi:hypothetical protein
MKLHLLQFDDEATAQNDISVGEYWNPPQESGGDFIPGWWDQDVTFANIGVWASQVAQTGWWIILALPNTDTVLAQHSACRLAWDNESAVILGGTYTGNDMAALYVSPVPAGSYNPWNGAAPE